MAARFTRQDVYEVCTSNTPKKRRSAVVNFILERFDSSNLSRAVKENIRVSARTFCQKIEIKQKKANKHKHIFLSKNSDWLRGEFRLSVLARVKNERKTSNRVSLCGKVRREINN